MSTDFVASEYQNGSLTKNLGDVVIDLATVPIAYNLFVSWFMRNIISKKLEVNTFNEFILNQTNVFTKQNYITNIDKLLKLHNINIPDFTRQVYNKFTQNDLKTFEFINKLTKTIYSGSDILNVFNEQNKYDNFATIQNLIDIYGEKNYITQLNLVNRTDLPKWNELSDDEKNKYNPRSAIYWSWNLLW